VKEKQKDDIMPESKDLKINESSITLKIYNEIKKIFGAGNQLFCMEMPARVVNPLDYSYLIEDYNSATLKKPLSVQDNEFRLSDNLFDPIPIVQGPNGSRLSVVYDTIVNNYVPNLRELKDFFQDKMDLRLFLLEEITDEIEGKKVTCSRMEFCQKTYLKYLKEKYNWEQEKLKQYNDNINDLDDYAKWLANNSWTKDQELANLFNDAIVRGYYHEIMTILGFLDISSSAERLSVSKINRRSSVRRSLDGSMDILPVQFQPSNWFRSLSPNFSPKDLTLDENFIKTELETKKNLLSSLETELAQLVNRNIDKKSVKELNDTIKNKKDKINEAEKEYVDKFGSLAINTIKTAISTFSEGDPKKVEDGTVKNLITNNIGKIASILGKNPEVVNKLVDGMIGLYKTNMDYFTLTDDLISLGRKAAEAQTGNMENEIGTITERINMVKNEINNISSIIINSLPNKTENTLDKGVLPSLKYNESSDYSDIILSHDSSKQEKSDFKSSESSRIEGGINFFFFKAKTQHESSSSNDEFFSAMAESKFQIGMRVTKVTIDRGGWFDPSILQNSKSYYRIQDLLGGAGLTVDEIYNKFEEGINIDDKYLLPAFPTSFIVVKDVVVKISTSNNNIQTCKKFSESRTSGGGGGIFGFNVSGGKEAKTYTGTEKIDDNNSSFYMRIPGPQILGWFLELPKEDKSTEYSKIDTNLFKVKDIMNNVNKSTEKLKEINNG